MMPYNLPLIPAESTVHSALADVIQPLLQLLGYERLAAGWAAGVAGMAGATSGAGSPDEGTVQFLHLPLFFSHSISIVDGELAFPRPLTTKPPTRGLPPHRRPSIPFLTLEMPGGGGRLITLVASPWLEAGAEALAATGAVRTLDLPLDARVVKLGVPFFTGLAASLMPFRVGCTQYATMCGMVGAGEPPRRTQLASLLEREFDTCTAQQHDQFKSQAVDLARHGCVQLDGRT
jgi:hypothetical protein